MKLIHLANGLFLALAAEPAIAATIAGPLYNPANGHIYHLLAYSTWMAAESEAMTLGGHLTTINDAAENQWVYDTFIPLARAHDPGLQGSVQLWIGLTDAALEGTFTWASGEPVLFTNWDVYQPNSRGGIQDYVHMRGPVAESPAFQRPGFWNDFSDTARTEDPRSGYFGVVEIVPEPSSLALLACGVLGSLTLRTGRHEWRQRRSATKPNCCTSTRCPQFWGAWS